MNNSKKNDHKELTKKAVAIGTALGVVATIGTNLNIKEAEARNRNTKSNKESRINSDKKFSHTKRPYTNADKANLDEYKDQHITKDFIPENTVTKDTKDNRLENKSSNRTSNRTPKVIPVSVSTARK